MKIAKGPPLVHKLRRATSFSSDEAQAMALRALAFLVEDAERIERFLGLTGVDPGDLRALAREPGFLLAVLDHLAGEEALLLDFAAREDVAPMAVGLARRALGGGEE